ncbi:MAG: adenylyl-sulfate kinase [Clostridia bacterium]|nr:adenylyl-sulfate kinase [Clostridia bacterium]
MDTCNVFDNKEMNIVIVGHVDHGKSTVIGRLLADTNSLPQGKLDQIKALCRRTDKPFEYAFLLDALKDERAQGITIDTARCFFKTEKRKYIIIDAPGHIEFLKNMITGASRAEAALLVIDAHEGIMENSRRHGYMLSMLGIRQVVVLVNKLDLVPAEDRQRVYEEIVAEYSAFLQNVEIIPQHFIPISAVEGYNIAAKSEELPWYDGITVLEALDAFKEIADGDDHAFRMWVQDVYKFTNSRDERRIIAGTVSAGRLHVGDEVMFLPSGKKTKVHSIEGFNEPEQTSVSTGKATGFCMTEQIYAKRGELCCKIGEQPPRTGSLVKTSIFWLGKEPLDTEKVYKIKIGSAAVGMRVEKILGVLNASTLENSEKQTVDRHEVAQCLLHFERPLAFDLSGQCADTSRFVIVDDYEIAGGGIITDVEEDEELEKKLIRRNVKWIQSSMTPHEREGYYRQQAQLIILTGNIQIDKKEIARKLEKKLLEHGKIAYYLGIGNVLYGVNSDIKSDDSMNSPEERNEHIRRLGEVANILLDAGNILIVTANELIPDELDTLRQIIRTDNIRTVWVGVDNRRAADFDFYYPVPSKSIADELAQKLFCI